jgi:hypothetical protein
MGRFVEQLVVSPLEPDWAVPVLHYDESRDVNLDEQARVAVEVDIAAGSTETFTKVTSESADSDLPNALRLMGTLTSTEVSGERSDNDQEISSYLYTETRGPSANESSDRPRI